jgi:hypothetical protein
MSTVQRLTTLRKSLDQAIRSLQLTKDRLDDVQRLEGSAARPERRRGVADRRA